MFVNKANHPQVGFNVLNDTFCLDDCGETLFFQATRGHVDDRKSMPPLMRLFRKKFADKGYISQKMTDLFALDDSTFITILKKNIKFRAIDIFTPKTPHY